MPELAYTFATIAEMLDGLDMSAEDQAWILQRYDPPRIQRHAAYTLWLSKTTDTIHNPIAWFKASIRGNWRAPQRFDAQQQIMYFRIDESTWAKFTSGYLCPICGGEHEHRDCPRLKGAK